MTSPHHTGQCTSWNEWFSNDIKTGFEVQELIVLLFLLFCLTQHPKTCYFVYLFVCLRVFARQSSCFVACVSVLSILLFCLCLWPHVKCEWVMSAYLCVRVCVSLCLSVSTCFSASHSLLIHRCLVVCWVRLNLLLDIQRSDSIHIQIS